MNTYLAHNGRETTLSEQKDEVMKPIRALRKEFRHHNSPQQLEQSEEEQSGTLLEDSHRLHSCLQDLGRFVFGVNPDEREHITGVFRDEYLHLLVETHLRLLRLVNEVSSENGKVKRELGETHVCVRNSAVLLTSIKTG
jgi:hypothetical protein